MFSFNAFLFSSFHQPIVLWILFGLQMSQVLAYIQLGFGLFMERSMWCFVFWLVMAYEGDVLGMKLSC